MATGAAERVLSVQSHVVFGYVGGKAAVFPLQCLGYDVDVVNTVHFSNHSGYPRTSGTKATAAELDDIFGGLERSELLAPTRLLTGYVPGAEGLRAVAKLARKLKQERPDLIYLLDPVMGDGGHLYVAPDVIPVYREMLPLASIIAPNWFEVEILTQVELRDLSSLRRALKILHEDYRVPNVVVTSIPLKPWLFDALPQAIRSGDMDHLLCVTSSWSSGASPSVVHARCVPLIRGYFSGVGDLFSALLLGHFNVRHASDSSSDHSTSSLPNGSSARLHDDSTPISTAASYALATTHHILWRTNEYALTLPEEDRQPTDDEKDGQEPLRVVKRMRGRELRIVQNQDALRGVGLDVTRMQLWDGFWRSD